MTKFGRGKSAQQTLDWATAPQTLSRSVVRPSVCWGRAWEGLGGLEEGYLRTGGLLRSNYSRAGPNASASAAHDGICAGPCNLLQGPASASASDPWDGVFFLWQAANSTSPVPCGLHCPLAATEKLASEYTKQTRKDPLPVQSGWPKPLQSSDRLSWSHGRLWLAAQAKGALTL